MAVLCPECESPVVIDVDEMEEGDTIACEECGTDLEIVSLDPPKLAVVDDSGYDDPEDPRFLADEDEEEG
jgi:alpha-aminoadipate carrier protein LysW